MSGLSGVYVGRGRLARLALAALALFTPASEVAAQVVRCPQEPDSTLVKIAQYLKDNGEASKKAAMFIEIRSGRVSQRPGHVTYYTKEITVDGKPVRLVYKDSGKYGADGEIGPLDVFEIHISKVPPARWDKIIRDLNANGCLGDAADFAYGLERNRDSHATEGSQAWNDAQIASFNREYAEIRKRIARNLPRTRSK